MRSAQPAQLTAPAVSPVEHWAVTAPEAVLEAANQQIRKSNKVLAVTERKITTCVREQERRKGEEDILLSA